ncbi:MAG: hypothetical protein ACK5Z5_08470 [Neisseriaceae bacterium]
MELSSTTINRNPKKTNQSQIGLSNEQVKKPSRPLFAHMHGNVGEFKQTLNESIKQKILYDMQTTDEDNRNIIFELHNVIYSIDTRDPITTSSFNSSKDIEKWCLLFSDTKTTHEKDTKFYTMMRIDSIVNLYIQSSNINKVNNPKTQKQINIETDIILLNSEHINYNDDSNKQHDNDTGQDSNTSIASKQKHPLIEKIEKAKHEINLIKQNQESKKNYNNIAIGFAAGSIVCFIAYFLSDIIPEYEVSGDTFWPLITLQAIKKHPEWTFYASIPYIAIALICKYLANNIPD